MNFQNIWKSGRNPGYKNVQGSWPADAPSNPTVICVRAMKTYYSGGTAPLIIKLGPTWT
jgi:hypothetical protein